jgi:hypothetical protein
MSKTLYVNSSNRDSLTTNENFTITDTSGRYTVPYRSIKLVSAIIPYTWNNIVTGVNDRFGVNEPPGVGTTTITIPAGSYTGPTLATAVQTALNAAGLGNTYTVTFNTSTLLFNFSATGNFILDFTISHSIASRLGFTVGTKTASGTSVNSAFIPQILVDNELFICSNAVGGIDNGFARLQPGAATNTQILAVIPITTTYGGIIEFAAPVDYPSFPISQATWGGQSASNPPVISFSLQFPSGFPISLFGQHWSCTLVLSP